MTRSDISAFIKNRYDFSKKDSEKIVKLFFQIFAKFLKEEKRVEVRGLGVFNPKIFIKDNNHFLRVSFKTSKTIMRILNNR